MRCTLKCTLGWKILVRNETVGGTSGYWSGTLIASSNRPPENGVSSGPCEYATGSQYVVQEHDVTYATRSHQALAAVALQRTRMMAFHMYMLLSSGMSCMPVLASAFAASLYS